MMKTIRLLLTGDHPLSASAARLFRIGEHQVLEAGMDRKGPYQGGWSPGLDPSGKSERFLPASRTISISVRGTIIPRDGG